MKILAPNKSYTGISAGVTFKEGVGYTDSPYLIAWFRENGYVVDSDNEPAAEPIISDMIPSADADIDKIPDLEDLSAEELIQFARDNSIDIGRATSKDTILKKILEAGDADGAEGQS